LRALLEGAGADRDLRGGLNAGLRLRLVLRAGACVRGQQQRCWGAGS
jgi:hypothetical protein